MSSFLALVLVPTHVFSDDMHVTIQEIVGQEDYAMWTLGQVGTGTNKINCNNCC